MEARHRWSGRYRVVPSRRARVAVLAIALAVASVTACTADALDPGPTADAALAADHAAAPAAADHPAAPAAATGPDVPWTAAHTPPADRTAEPPAQPTGQPPTGPGGTAAPTARATDPTPAGRFAIGVRTVLFSRGADRPLPTTVWYPAAGKRAGGTHRDAPVAVGRFPIVLFSHGLNGLPARYAALNAAWAAAGFVVAAPTYPHTHAGTAHFDRRDIAQQPADATAVIDGLRALDENPADPLAGRIDGDRVAAVGHSAGGYTTTGLFTAGHDARLRSAVVIAGWQATGAFDGPPATMLFIHGSADHVIPAAIGRAAYDQVPWSKFFLLLQRRWHSDYLRPGQPGYRLVRDTVLDFLRWTLNGDETAHRRLPPGSFPTAAAGLPGQQPLLAGVTAH
jgi:dienelactone hydrolase